jgi:hypothetical protein
VVRSRDCRAGCLSRLCAVRWRSTHLGHTLERLIDSLAQQSLHRHSSLATEPLQKPVFLRRQLESHRHLFALHVAARLTTRDVHSHLRWEQDPCAPVAFELCSPGFRCGKLATVTTTPLPAETTWSPPTATLFQRLAALRGELDRVVRELNVLCTGCATDADKQLRDLHGAVQRARSITTS